MPYIDSKIYNDDNNKYHNFVKNNIKLLHNLFNYLKDYKIKDIITKIFNSEYIKFEDNIIKFTDTLIKKIGENYENLNELNEDNETKKDIKNDFNKIKNKLNKLSYLITYIENWKDTENDRKNLHLLIL